MRRNHKNHIGSPCRPVFAFPFKIFWYFFDPKSKDLFSSYNEAKTLCYQQKPMFGGSVTWHEAKQQQQLYWPLHLTEIKLTWNKN